jgi:2-amino-4-hydroxy-6-hydroxymethyldihydropteridine diphosphokinase
MPSWRPAYVALGSNLADPAAQVGVAIGRLRQIRATRLIAHSRLWASRPLGPPDQPDFVNAVAGLLTQLDARELLGELQALEAALGRTEPVVRWGPRIIDLDLLALGSEELSEPGLRLPHPGVHERDFVLYPLAELAPELWIPGRGRVEALVRRVANRGIVPLSK